MFHSYLVLLEFGLFEVENLSPALSTHLKVLPASGSTSRCPWPKPFVFVSSPAE